LCSKGKVMKCTKWITVALHYLNDGASHINAMCVKVVVINVALIIAFIFFR